MSEQRKIDPDQLLEFVQIVALGPCYMDGPDFIDIARLLLDGQDWIPETVESPDEWKQEKWRTHNDGLS